MKIGIKAIEYVLPEAVLTNEMLAELYGDWTAEKIFNKTGIASRHICREDETALDLAERAAKKLFATGVAAPGDIDYLLLATETPDYQIPPNACILQDRLGIPKTAGALDYTLACSAYVYGLMLAKGLIAGQIAKNVLLITAETYSKHIHPMDKSTRTIFGDGAAATLICAGEDVHAIGAFAMGTDGSGYNGLWIPAGGARQQRTADTAKVYIEENGTQRTQENVFMDGPEVFNFTIRVAGPSVKAVLEKENLQMEDIDLFVFHQANAFILEFLRKKIKIPKEKYFVDMADIGNTVSSTLPIALKRVQEKGRLQEGQRALLLAFGVGWSWGANIVTW